MRGEPCEWAGAVPSVREAGQDSEEGKVEVARLRVLVRLLEERCGREGRVEGGETRGLDPGVGSTEEAGVAPRLTGSLDRQGAWTVRRVSDLRGS